MAILNNPTGGTLGGTLTVAAVGGIATFNNLNIDKAGSGYTLRATSGVLTAATSNAFDILVGAADRTTSTIAADPATITADGTSTSTVLVQLKDANGNNLTSGGATVILATTLGSMGAVTDNGNGTYSATLTSGTVAGIATVTGTLNGDAITDSAQVTFSPGAADRITLTGPASVTAGATSGNFTLAVVDVNGNSTVVSADTTFNLTTDQESGTAAFTPATPATVAAGASSVTFAYANTRVGAGTHRITATRVSGDALPGGTSASHDIAVNAGSPATINLTGPVSVTVGATSDNFTLTVLDAYANLSAVSGDTSFALSSTSGGTVTFTPASPMTVVNGSSSATFTYSDTEAGNQTVTATWTSGGSNLGNDTHLIQVEAAPVTLSTPPELGLVAGSTGYMTGTAGIQILSAAIVTDVDTGDFRGGVLTVTLTTQATAGDQLFITDTTRISTTGSSVNFDGAPIGAFVYTGDPTYQLAVTLAAISSITQEAVEQLLLSVAFSSTAASLNLADRQVEFILEDDGGGVSDPVAVTVVVSEVDNGGPKFATVELEPVLPERPDPMTDAPASHSPFHIFLPYLNAGADER
jgi:adhesin/invasin